VGQRLAGGQTLPVETGNELDDVMATVKVAVDKLSIVLEKIDPILEDTRKQTHEAASIRQTVSTSLTVTMANIQAMSGQFKQTSESARALVGNIDSDRAKVVSEVQGLLKTLNKDLPQALDKSKETLENAKAATADVRQILRESRNDLPAIVRSGRTAAQDAAEITTGLKGSWPFSGAASPAEPATLPLDSFEGRAQ
jgi:ABC-type transporter Mla subunit MlaD